MQAPNKTRGARGMARGVASSQSWWRTLVSRLTIFVLAIAPLFSAGQEIAPGAGQAPLVILGDKNYPPADYLEEGVAKGMDVDFVKALAQVMQRDIRIELMDWNLAQEKVLHGEADGLVGMTISEPRRKQFEFAESTFTREFAFVVRTGEMTVHDASDLRAKKVGETPGGFPKMFLGPQPGVAVISINDYRDGLNRLVSREIDVMAADRWVAAYLIEKGDIHGVTIAKKPFAKAPCAIAVRKGNTALVEEFNRAIHTLKSQGKIAEIEDAWRPQEIIFVSRERARNTVAAVVGTFLVTLLGVMGIWVFTLRQQVRARREAEEQLRWRTAFFEAQVHSAVDGILVVDSQNRKILQNQRMNDLWKIPPEIVAASDNTSQYQFIIGRVKYPQPFAAKVAHLYAHPDETSIDEIELIDGTVLQRYSAPVRDNDGKYYGRVWTFRDITESTRAEAALRQSEERLSQMFKGSPIPIVLTRMADDVLLDANESFLRMAGYTREEAIGHTSQELGFLSEPDVREFIISQLQQYGHLHGYERPFRTKSGQIRNHVLWLEVISVSGEKCILLFAQDVTERKKMEEQFLRAQRMESIGTLAGGIAHDLNNVLSPIILSLDLLKLESASPVGQQLISLIASSAQRGAAMVSQVLSFARGVGGQRVKLQLAHVIRDVEKIANDTFLKDIQVQTIIPPDLWTVLGDPTQLHQVLLNLCVNARDAMSNGGTLTIAAENLTIDPHYAGMVPGATPGPYVLLRVQDCGTGIPPEVMGKIFDPFFTTKEVGKGTGLGLSTTLGIVKNHGGFIQVCSELQKGTTFKVYLPALTEGASDMSVHIPVELPRGNGELILVIDDESSVREIARQTLEAFGYRVVLASDGAEAVGLCAQLGDEVDVAFTDVTMPIMDGPAAIQVLHRLKPDLPIVVASGLPANGLAGDLASLGVRHFLPKPYTTETLLNALRQSLSRE